MTDDRIQQHLADLRLLNGDHHALVLALRELILGLAPGISEGVKYGGILFAAGEAFCGVFAYARHVSLEFGSGASLADPYGVLEGNGKFRRHIKLSTLADMEAKQVRHYLLSALAATPAA